MEKNNIPEFEKIIRNEKVVLVDPVSKVYLGVSNKIANNLDKQEVKEFLYPIWKKQASIQQKIIQRHEKFNTVYLMITRKCNMNCDFCAINANHGMNLDAEINIDDIKKKIIPFLNECSPHKFIITGGEPFVKDNILQIIEEIHKGTSIPIIVQSNGIAVNTSVIEKLKGKVKEIDFSTKHMFGEMGKADELISNIEICQQSGIDVVLSFIYEKSNKKELYEVIDIAAKYNTGLLVNIVAPVGRAREKVDFLTDLDKIQMNLDIAKYIYDHDYEEKALCGVIDSHLQVRNACGGYGKVLAIFPEGNIYMCQCLENDTYRLGNVLYDEVETIENNLCDKMGERVIQKTFCVDDKDICNKCEYRYFCTGKCPTSVDKDDYTCYFVKKMIDYQLFYKKMGTPKKVLEEYITYMNQCLLEYTNRK
ncbi:radical SAM additional 4Fe4S-binding SPASM domain-containing protein [Lachnospiraceae bacterium 3-1]|nr:radical SAM additional 4Fe4S-binding SPASM domain-containing protein [Lachnospiraceae bacterium 3-1]